MFIIMARVTAYTKRQMFATTPVMAISNAAVIVLAYCVTAITAAL